MFFDQTAVLILLAVAIISVFYVVTREANNEDKIEAFGGRAQRISVPVTFWSDFCHSSALAIANAVGGRYRSDIP